MIDNETVITHGVKLHQFLASSVSVLLLRGSYLYMCCSNGESLLVPFSSVEDTYCSVGIKSLVVTLPEDFGAPRVVAFITRRDTNDDFSYHLFDSIDAETSDAVFLGSCTGWKYLFLLIL